jgi:hypothetical protein
MSDTPRYGGKTPRELRSYYPDSYGEGRVIHDLLAAVEARDSYAGQLEYVVRMAAEWDPENTDCADLAALGAYARAALSSHEISKEPRPTGNTVSDAAWVGNLATALVLRDADVGYATAKLASHPSD